MCVKIPLKLPRGNDVSNQELNRHNWHPDKIGDVLAEPIVSAL